VSVVDAHQHLVVAASEHREAVARLQICCLAQTQRSDQGVAQLHQAPQERGWGGEDPLAPDLRVGRRTTGQVEGEGVRVVRRAGRQQSIQGRRHRPHRLLVGR